MRNAQRMSFSLGCLYFSGLCNCNVTEYLYCTPSSYLLWPMMSNIIMNDSDVASPEKYFYGNGKFPEIFC